MAAVQNSSSPTSHCMLFLSGAVVGAGACCWLGSRLYRHAVTSADGVDGYISKPSNGGCDADDRGASAQGNHSQPRISLRDFDKDAILSEHLTRNVQFFGLEAQKSISNAFVVVIGLGGVGSHAAHLLLRSGVGRLRLVDFDQVTLSSLNRHCLATRADVGTPKATCLVNHFKDILPEAEVEALIEMYNSSTENSILSGAPSFVLDAIDNIDTKVALLAACHSRNIPVLSVAGAGAKADPTRLKIVDIAESSIDPLARAVRYRLRKDHGITTGVPVLLSTEKPRCGLIFAPGEDASKDAPATNPLDYQIVPNFRIRTIPVLGTVPALFGMAAASYILCQLADAPFHPEPIFRLQAQALQTQFDRLEAREWDRAGNLDGLQVDAQEVEVLVRELWRGQSARYIGQPPHDKALTRALGDLTLTRWDPRRNATVDNLVLLKREEADAHDAQMGQPGGWERLHAEEREVCERVERVLRRARAEFMYRYYATNGV